MPEPPELHTTTVTTATTDIFTKFIASAEFAITAERVFEKNSTPANSAVQESEQVYAKPIFRAAAGLGP
ncbi:MAG: hypothetical protein O6945_07130 [Gammaproteobacteria bacterium]|nr:hypothetical protein [Gammaproteobacteria bacterium]